MTAADVSRHVAAGTYRSSDFAWKDGMAEWVAISDSGVLAEAGQAGSSRAPIPGAATVVAQAATSNPYAPSGSSLPVGATSAVAMEYPGIGRLQYFLYPIGLGFAAAILFGILGVVGSAMGGSGEGATIVVGILGILIYVAALVCGLMISVKRLQNLGMSGWMLLLYMVPILNIWISWRMTACPAGYDHHRQLDTAGKVITWLMVGLVVLYLVVLFAAIGMAPSR